MSIICKCGHPASSHDNHKCRHNKYAAFWDDECDCEKSEKTVVLDHLKEEEKYKKEYSNEIKGDGK